MLFLNFPIDKSKKSVYNKGNRRILKEKYFRRIQHSTKFFYLTDYLISQMSYFQHLCLTIGIFHQGSMNTAEKKQIRKPTDFFIAVGFFYP